MIIIETCPECRHDLYDELLATFPLIRSKRCFNCGWSWTGEREEVLRIPFGGNSYTEISTKLPKTLNVTALNESYGQLDNFSQAACQGCSANPKNGGDGICFCTLGLKQFT